MRLPAFLFLMAIQGLLMAQDGKFNFGARNLGIGGASLTLVDHFSLFNNVGGLGRIDGPGAFAGYQNRYGISELQTIGAGAVYKASIGSAGIGFYKFGGDLFTQQRLHLAIGNQIQLVSLGMGIDLVQYNVSSIGTKQVIALQFGGIAEISQQLVFGAHIFNLNQARLIEETAERLPTVMKAGLSYRPGSELMINMEVEKDLGFEEVIKAGIEYEIISKVFLRTGITKEPFASSFGVGFHPKKLRFDYAFADDSALGPVHEFSMAYSLSK